MIWNTAYKIVSKFYKAVNKTIRIIITTVVILLIVSGITAGTGWLLLHNLYEQSREEEYKILSNLNEGTFRRMRNTEIYDKNGNKIGEIKAADFQYTKLKDICSLIQEGYIAVEDVRFKEHNGIDPQALLRAGAAYVKKQREHHPGRIDHHTAGSQKHPAYAGTDDFPKSCGNISCHGH